MYRFLILLIFSFSITGTSISQENPLKSFREIQGPYKCISPKVAQLLSLNKEDLKTQLEKVWLSAKKDGLPLIEMDPLDEDYCFLTFLFRENAPSKTIAFEVFGIYEDNCFGDMKLRHLKETDLYHRSYKVPNDLCFAYRFIVENTLGGDKNKVTDQYNSERVPKGEIKSFSYSVCDLRKDEPDWNAKKYHHLNSTIDTIKYTDKVVNKERNIYIYLPPDYNKTRKEAYPVIYLFDAFIYLNRVEVPNILDNLITEGKIEPMIAVFYGTYRNTRGITLPLNAKFKDDFVFDFLPLIRNKYNVSLTADGNIIGGMSYGGLAAAFIAFYHPETFGKVLSQSGSFWRGLELTDGYGHWIRQDWLIDKYLSVDRKNIKLYLDWGLQENYVLGSNKRMVKALNTKGYDFKLTEFNGWHDWSNSRKTFADGLLYLLKD
jgi:enterochelin esterase-like enzyme